MSLIERVVAEAEIARVVTRYAMLNDAGDFDALAALFTEDGVFARPSGGEPVRGRAAILDSYKSRPARISRHVIANILADVFSESEATCRSTMVLYSAPVGDLPTKAGPALLGGFEDRLVRVGGAWLFKERRGWVDLRIGE